MNQPGQVPGVVLRTQHLFDGVADRGPGIVEVADGVIIRLRPDESGAPDDVDAGTPGSAEVIDLGAQVLSPGLVDVHCHGGGGASFGTDPRTALNLHRAHGTTSTVASLVSQSLPELERQVRALVPLVRADELAGIHLEGPWLAPGRKGAHPAEMLRPPTRVDVARLLDAGQGSV
ncbi:MAG: hypothetical protein WBL05_04010, partial [Brooklawnia sp.]